MRFQQLLAAAIVVSALPCTGAAAGGDPRSDQTRPREGERDSAAVQRDRDREDSRLRGMDTDNDGVITRAEWRGDDQGFRQQDTNRDGVLSGGELVTRAPAERVRRRDELVAQFTRADRDSDDRLRRNEWTAELGSFAEADANRDRTITRAEFLAYRNAARNGASDGSASELRRGSPAFQAGFDRGLVDGRQAGKEDRTVNGGKWDLDGQRELEQADAGYEARVGERVDYQAGYRAGFLRGYTEGFGPR